MTQRTIVVAGGASGIGLATAQRAVADGWRTIIVDIQDPLEPVAARLVKCDLLDADAARTALEGIVRDEERVDALVASAGGQMGGALAAYDVEEWTQRFTANTLPVLRSIRSLLPALQAAAAANGVADIIVVGSIAGDTAFETTRRSTAPPLRVATPSASSCGWSCARSRSGPARYPWASSCRP